MIPESILRIAKLWWQWRAYCILYVITVTTIRVDVAYQIIDLSFAKWTEFGIYILFIFEMGKSTRDFKSTLVIALLNSLVLPNFAFIFLWPLYSCLLSI